MVVVWVIVILGFGLLFEDSCSHTVRYGNTAIAIVAILNMGSHGALVIPSIDPTRPSDHEGPTNWQHYIRCFNSNSCHIPVNPATCSGRTIRSHGQNRESWTLALGS